MGVSASKIGEVKLVQQEELLCATEPRFCLPEPTTLRLQQSFWWWENNIQITDASKDIVYFHCLKDSKQGWPGKKALVDLAGIHIFFLKDKLTSTTHKYKFFGSKQEKGSYPEISAFGAWDKGACWKYKHTIQITDVLTRTKKNIVVRAMSKTIGRRECVIYYVGNEGKEIPVGKIYPKNPDRRVRNVDYMLEIAPGVDIVLMLIACSPLKLYQYERQVHQRRIGVTNDSDFVGDYGFDCDYGGGDGGCDGGGDGGGGGCDGGGGD